MVRQRVPSRAHPHRATVSLPLRRATFPFLARWIHAQCCTFACHYYRVDCVWRTDRGFNVDLRALPLFQRFRSVMPQLDLVFSQGHVHVILDGQFVAYEPLAGLEFTLRTDYLSWIEQFETFLRETQRLPVWNPQTWNRVTTGYLRHTLPECEHLWWFRVLSPVRVYRDWSSVTRWPWVTRRCQDGLSLIKRSHALELWLGATPLARLDLDGDRSACWQRAANSSYRLRLVWPWLRTWLDSLVEPRAPPLFPDPTARSQASSVCRRHRRSTNVALNAV